MTLWILVNETSTSGAARSSIVIRASPRNTSGPLRNKARALSEPASGDSIPTMTPVHVADPTPVGVVPEYLPAMKPKAIPFS